MGEIDRGGVDPILNKYDVCWNGHLQTPENVYVGHDGRRQCRKCHQRKATAKWREKRRVKRREAALERLMDQQDSVT